MTTEELKQKYNFIEDYLCDNGADNQYHNCLDDIYGVAKPKIKSSNSDYAKCSIELLFLSEKCRGALKFEDIEKVLKEHFA
jgi:hypothetical protein